MDGMMNAVSITSFGDAEGLRVSRVPVPTLKAHEVLIRNRAIGVNFVDIQHRSGRPYPVELPLILGIEAAGVVVSTGEAVRTVTEGQRVAVAGHMVGIYAEYVACPEEFTIPLPEAVDYEAAASSLLQGMTAHALSNEAYPIRNGETVLIQAAAGGVGLLLTQIAKMRGATVIGTCSTEKKAAAVREAGGDEVI
ncbi:MAG: alcohol dehydrogenase catalytic domain-containing protein, partial [Spirochaetales bacterium]|nr:alcohol dehydrogenase catalytic domain-containing protein [Spirochaetales bacterium]